MKEVKAGNYTCNASDNTARKMTRLKVGDWVLSKSGTYIGKLKKINGDVCTIKYTNGREFDDELIKHHKQATVLDYLRTLSDYRMAEFIRTCCYTFRDLGSNSIYNCTVDIAEFLNEPLTDEIVNKLGGK